MGIGASALLQFDRLQGIDDGKQTTEVHQLYTHDNTWIQAVYTNKGSTIDRVLAMYDEMLKDEDDKFVGLDLEYNLSQEKITVIHLAIKEHVLVFHIIRCKDYVSSLRDFLWCKGYTFVGVDIRNDNRLLYTEWLYIPKGKHVVIQKIFRLKGCGYRAGMAAMAAKLDDCKYTDQS